MNLLAPFLVLMLATPLVAMERHALEFESVSYHIITALPGEISLRWKNSHGEIFATFAEVKDALASEGKTAEMMMNAGIFEPGGIPSGLHVEDGKEWLPLNTREGKGNFYLKPNGVFYWSGDACGVIPTEEYAKLQVKPRFALQSGPLLLREGKIHPEFRQDSDNRLHRNGVGVTRSGQVVLAITDWEKRSKVNLHGFARLFRRLECPNALFLDGDISQIYLRDRTTRISGNRFGAILVVAE